MAWAMLALGVLLGLAASAWSVGWPRRAWTVDLHRYTATLAVVFTGIHLLAILADGFVDFGAIDLLVPYASEWNPAAVAWGVVALYLLAAVEITSWLRLRIGRKAWLAVHLLSYPLLAVATIHGASAGEDAGPAVFRWTIWPIGAVIGWLAVYRVLAYRPRRLAGARTGTFQAK